jgi:signal transduction histidine kinase
MGYQCDIIGEAGLQFFGKMSASLSHEIKNVLAVMNENAGLIQDYTSMVQNGKPLDAERIKTLAGKIRGQVQRADNIVKNLNRLAHSVDEYSTHIDVGELMTFLVTLCGRISSVRGVSIELEPSRVPVTISTHPFFLKNLVWLCLDFAMNMADENKSIGVFIENKEKGVQIRLTGLENLAQASKGAFPGKNEKALFDALGADSEADAESGELIITLFDG